MAQENLTPILVGTGLGFGALAALAPGALARVYGMNGDGEALAALQLFGTRTFALGALAATARDDEMRDTIATAVGVACAADALASVMNGLRGRIRGRTSAMSAVTSAAVAALCAAYVKPS